MSELRKKASRGVFWNLFNQGIQQVIQFFVVIVLARLLRPEDFGVFAMAAIFSNFLQSFREWGFQAFLIQKANIDQEYQDTAFWAILVTGCFLFVCSISCAPLVGAFFDNREVVLVFRVISFCFLLSPFGAVQWALVTRELNFKALALRNIFAQMAYGITACYFAYSGIGVWSLVMATLCREISLSILFWVIYDWRPRFQYSLVKLKEMMHFSIHFIGSSTIQYAINNMDGAFVGKFLGAVNLGQYNLAVNLISQPQNKLVSHISSVTFPMFSKVQHDLETMQVYYIKILKAVLVVVIPILAILCACAHDFITLVYGEKWIPAVVPVQIMCGYGIIKTINAIIEPVFFSKGKVNIYFRLNLIKITVFILSITIGIRYGIIGVATALLVCSFVLAIPVIHYANKILRLRNRFFYAIITRYLFLFITVILITYYSIYLLNFQDYLSTLLNRLLFGMIGGIVGYAILGMLIIRDDFKSVFMLLKRSIKNE